jgi:ferredoxin
MGCGICSETCPTNAVYLVQGRNSDVSKTELLKCISCMHCITVCASDARRVPIAEKAAIHAALAKSASSRKEPKFYL